MKTVYGRGPYGLSGRPTDASPWARAPPSCANYPSPFSPHLNDPVAPLVLLYLVYTQTTIYIYIYIYNVAVSCSLLSHQQTIKQSGHYFESNHSCTKCVTWLARVCLAYYPFDMEESRRPQTSPLMNRIGYISRTVWLPLALGFVTCVCVCTREHIRDSFTCLRQLLSQAREDLQTNAYTCSCSPLFCAPFWSLVNSTDHAHCQKTLTQLRPPPKEPSANESNRITKLKVLGDVQSFELLKKGSRENAGAVHYVILQGHFSPPRVMSGPLPRQVIHLHVSTAGWFIISSRSFLYNKAICMSISLSKASDDTPRRAFIYIYDIICYAYVDYRLEDLQPASQPRDPY